MDFDGAFGTGIEHWLCVSFACFVIFKTLFVRDEKPSKTQYAERLNLSPEQADALFAPQEDRLYGLLVKARVLTTFFIAFAFLVVSFVPGLSGQNWKTLCIIAPLYLWGTIFALIGLFRARTQAKVERLGNIANFLPNEIGRPPESARIYTLQIYGYRAVGFLMLSGLVVSGYIFVSHFSQFIQP